jgi:hypothetical protein
VLPQPGELNDQDIARLDRPRLIALLLEFNNRRTFQFNRAWLERQWTSRLRALLFAVRRECEEHHGEGGAA